MPMVIGRQHDYRDCACYANSTTVFPASMPKYLVQMIRLWKTTMKPSSLMLSVKLSWSKPDLVVEWHNHGLRGLAPVTFWEILCRAHLLLFAHKCHRRKWKHGVFWTMLRKKSRPHVNQEHELLFLPQVPIPDRVRNEVVRTQIQMKAP